MDQHAGGNREFLQLPAGICIQGHQLTSGIRHVNPVPHADQHRGCSLPAPERKTIEGIPGDQRILSLELAIHYHLVLEDIDQALAGCDHRRYGLFTVPGGPVGASNPANPTWDTDLLIP